MKLKFTAITGDSHQLYALSDEGKVYRYVNANESDGKHYSFWSRLTDYSPEDKDNDTKR